MKKTVSLVLVFIMIIGGVFVNASANNEYPFKTEDGIVRDPYVLVYDGKYYLYGTCLSNGNGYGCVVSEDLQNWSYPVQVYTPEDGSEEIADFWAPECH